MFSTIAVALVSVSAEGGLDDQVAEVQLPLAFSCTDVYVVQTARPMLQDL